MVSFYRAIKTACIVLNTAMYVLLLVMNYASSHSSGIMFGNQSIGKVARKYYTEFNPAPWAFDIWKLVNAWTVAWIFYSLSHIFRRNTLDVLNAPFFAFFSLATVANMAWTLFMSWEIIRATAVFVFLLVAFLYASLAVSYVGLYRHRYSIVAFDFWAIQLLINNGIAVYATWTTVAALRGLAVIMTYYHGLEQDMAVTVVLGILTVTILVWYVLENTILEKNLRYTLTIYPVLIWVFVASVVMNFNPVNAANTAIMRVLLTVSCMFCVARLCNVLRFIRPKKKSNNADVAMSEIIEGTPQTYTEKADNSSHISMY